MNQTRTYKSEYNRLYAHWRRARLYAQGLDSKSRPKDGKYMHPVSRKFRDMDANQKQAEVARLRKVLDDFVATAGNPSPKWRERRALGT